MHKKKNYDSMFLGIKQLVNVCAAVKPGELVVIVADTNTAEIGMILKNAVLEISKNVSFKVIKPLKMHGSEPKEEIASDMLKADIIFGLTTMSMAHTTARKNATDLGARYLSLPQYTKDTLSRPALLADFKGITETADRLRDVFSNGSSLTVRADNGTELSCNIVGRKGNSAPGWCYKKGVMSSPPDAETNIAPIEGSAEGVIVVDGSIPAPGFGVLKSPLKIVVKNGMINSVDGLLYKEHIKLFKTSGCELSKILAEVGIGLNPLAELCGSMLEDEGCLGTAHFGFGSNATIGGNNQVSFHIDHVIKRATVEVDGQLIINNGKLLMPLWRQNDFKN